MSQLLKDRYYLGLVTYKSEIYEGRHPAIVPEELFQKVQDLLETRGVAGERLRVYDHYLKGSLWCGRCYRQHQIEDRRMIVQRSIGRNGEAYFYFFCRGNE